MVKTIKRISGFVLLLGLCTYSPLAAAEDKPAKSAKHDEAHSEKAKKSPKNKPSPKNATQSDNSSNDKDFVDRDGDGIRDGKEHRFRRNSKKRQNGGRHGLKQRRNQNGARYRKGNSS
jgi:hypothetical protein